MTFRASCSLKSRPATILAPRVAKNPGETAFIWTSRSVMYRSPAWIVRELLHAPPRPGRHSCATPAGRAQKPQGFAVELPWEPAHPCGAREGTSESVGNAVQKSAHRLDLQSLRCLHTEESAPAKSPLGPAPLGIPRCSVGWRAALQPIHR